jgi:uncharacterized protein
MRLAEADYPAGVPIDGYAPGHFRIAGQVHGGPLILSAGRVLPWGGLEDGTALAALAGQVDVLFIGTGAALVAPSAQVRAALDRAGIGLEIMVTPSACRCFNICLAEGRRVAAALMPV